MWALAFKVCLAVLIITSTIIIIGALLRINAARRTSYVWINQLYILFIAAVGYELVYELIFIDIKVPMTLLLIEGFTIISLCCCAMLSLPLKKHIYARVGYDKLYNTNRELEHSRELFSIFMNKLPIVACIRDEQGTIIYVNNKFSEYLQVTPEQMIGTKDIDWIRPEDAWQVLRNNKIVRDSGKEQEFIEEFVTRGQLFKLFSIRFQLEGPCGETFIASISLEISADLQSRSMDALLASVAQASSDAIYSIDEDSGLVTSWNSGAEKMFGYTADEIIGKSINILRTEKQQKLIETGSESPEPGVLIVDHEVVRVAKGGHPKPVMMSAVRVKGFCDRWNHAVIARDITEEKQAEILLKRLHAETNDRHAKLTETNQELLVARDEALEASRTASALVANISHQLRTPLSGILGLTELAQAEPIDSETTDMLQIVTESALALLTIINDILDLSKLESGIITLDNHPFSLAVLLNDCMKLVAPAISRKQLQTAIILDPELPSLVDGDVGRIRQVLLNLLGNAVKFTEQGMITAECTLIAETNDILTIQFAVTDTGIGIKAEEQERLFTPYSRISSTASGTGLGLAISKQFVELMGGAMGVESKPDSGSRFWFTITLNKALDIPEQPELPAIPPPATLVELTPTLNVLSVEDNPTLAKMIKQQLTRLGYTAESVATGREAIEAAATGQFNIILMDIHLPDISGYRVTQRIRARERRTGDCKHIIIAMTAGAMPGDREKAIAVGMDDYLAKPVSIDQLKTTISKHLARRALSPTRFPKASGQ